MATKTSVSVLQQVTLNQLWQRPKLRFAVEQLNGHLNDVSPASTKRHFLAVSSGMLAGFEQKLHGVAYAVCAWRFTIGATRSILVVLHRDDEHYYSAAVYKRGNVKRADAREVVRRLTKRLHKCVLAEAHV